MTFQIGMVGSDGVLLASDTLCTHLHQPNDGALVGTRTTSNAPKIEVDSAKGIAYCWSGDEFGRILVGQIADLINEASVTDMRFFLSRCSQEAIHRATVIKAANPGVPIGSCELLLAIQTESDSVALWKTRVVASPNQFIPPAIDRITSEAVIGDAVNSAAFFAERYFPKFRQLPIEELIPLAAHAVMMAGKLNSAGVGGLQIVACRANGFRGFSEKEILSFEERSAKCDSEIAALLGIG